MQLKALSILNYLNNSATVQSKLFPPGLLSYVICVCIGTSWRLYDDRMSIVFPREKYKAFSEGHFKSRLKHGWENLAWSSAPWPVHMETHTQMSTRLKPLSDIYNKLRSILVCCGRLPAVNLGRINRAFLVWNRNEAVLLILQLISYWKLLWW